MVGSGRTYRLALIAGTHDLPLPGVISVPGGSSEEEQQATDVFQAAADGCARDGPPAVLMREVGSQTTYSCNSLHYLFTIRNFHWVCVIPYLKSGQ